MEPASRIIVYVTVTKDDLVDRAAFRKSGHVLAKYLNLQMGDDVLGEGQRWFVGRPEIGDAERISKDDTLPITSFFFEENDYDQPRDLGRPLKRIKMEEEDDDEKSAIALDTSFATLMILEKAIECQECAINIALPSEGQFSRWLKPLCYKIYNELSFGCG